MVCIYIYIFFLKLCQAERINIVPVVASMSKHMNME